MKDGAPPGKTAPTGEPEARPVRRRRRGRRLFVILLAVVVVLWCGYWFASQKIATEAAIRLAASMAAGGRTVTCTDAGTGGFPFHLDLTCTDARFADSEAGTRFALSDVSASAPLYWPGAVNARIAAPLSVEIPERDLALDAVWSNAVASMEAGLNGLISAGFAFADLEVTPRASRSAVPFANLDAKSAEFVAEPADDNAYRVHLTTGPITLTTPDGRTLPAVATEIDATALDFGSSLGTDPGQAVRAWVSGGGELELDRFAAFLGASVVEARGNLTVAPDGLLSGKLVVRFTGLDTLPATMDAIRPGSAEKVGQALGAVAMMSTPVDGDPNVREMPVTLNDGVAMIGVIPIGSVPPLRL